MWWRSNHLIFLAFLLVTGCTGTLISGLVIRAANVQNIAPMIASLLNVSVQYVHLSVVGQNTGNLVLLLPTNQSGYNFILQCAANSSYAKLFEQATIFGISTILGSGAPIQPTTKEPCCDVAPTLRPAAPAENSMLSTNLLVGIAAGATVPLFVIAFIFWRLCKRWLGGNHAIHRNSSFRSQSELRRQASATDCPRELHRQASTADLPPSRPHRGLMVFHYEPDSLQTLSSSHPTGWSNGQIFPQENACGSDPVMRPVIFGKTEPNHNADFSDEPFDQTQLFHDVSGTIDVVNTEGPACETFGGAK